jgi:uncharacterized protein (UPF0332 family)
MKDVNEVINLRLRKSDETFEDARWLVAKKHWTSVINRLYYAAFYAISALLLKNSIYSKTHSGLKTKFNEFIKEKNIKYVEAKIYNELFDYRHDADYNDFIVFTKEEVEILIERTEKLISEIKKLINNDVITN